MTDTIVLADGRSVNVGLFVRPVTKGGKIRERIVRPVFRYWMMTEAHGPVGFGWGAEILHLECDAERVAAEARVWWCETASGERRYSDRYWGAAEIILRHRGDVIGINAAAATQAADAACEQAYREAENFLSTRLLPLSQGLAAVVDAVDYAAVANHKWSAVLSGGRWYAVRQRKDTDGKWRSELLHRAVAAPRPDQHVDHIDGYGLDNRRRNIRPCTNQQNVCNSRSRPGTSRFKGVAFDRRRRDWSAQIHLSGRKKHLGYFADETDAARTYDAAAREYFGEFARLNFPWEHE